MGKAFRYLSLFFICLVSIHESIAQNSKVRIACIGNSITFGARVQNPQLESYPAVLSAMLNGGGYTGYEVVNFGIGGATVLRFGTPNIWKVLDSLKLARPDVVVIEVGTNETVSAPRYNWEHIADFEKDYSEYINAIRKINPNCNFIICSPLDMVIQTDGLSPERIKDLSLRRPRIWELRKRVKKIAKKEGAYYLDLTKPFKGKTSLMTTSDGVHPNKDGYYYLATLVFDFMVKKEIVNK
jgi:acyl-CoA thioesterase I